MALQVLGMEKLPFADLCSDEGGKLIADTSHDRLKFAVDRHKSISAIAFSTTDTVPQLIKKCACAIALTLSVIARLSEKTFISSWPVGTITVGQRFDSKMWTHQNSIPKPSAFRDPRSTAEKRDSCNNIADIIQVGRAMIDRGYQCFFSVGCNDPDTRTSDYISKGERIISYVK